MVWANANRIAPSAAFLQRQMPYKSVGIHEHHGQRLALDNLPLCADLPVKNFDSNILYGQVAQRDICANFDLIAHMRCLHLARRYRTDRDISPRMVNSGFPFSQHSGSRAIILRKISRSRMRLQVEPLGIFLHHAVGIELWTQHAHGIFHPGNPASGHPIHTAIIKKRHGFFLENIVNRPRFNLVLIRRIVVFFAVSNLPAQFRLMRFCPPAIEHTEIQRAIGNGFHATGTARFLGSHRRIQPDIDPLHEITRHTHIVILDKNQTAMEILALRKTENFLDKFFPRMVLRVRFARKNNLNRTFLIAQNAREPFEIVKQKRCAFISCKTPGKTNRKRIGSQDFVRTRHID